MSVLVLAACPSVPLVETVDRWPGTGEPSFPPNGTVDYMFIGSATELASPGVEIHDAGHAIVPSTTIELSMPGADRHIFVVTPTQPLAASTTYTLADGIDWSCAAEPCGVAVKETTVFTTAAAADTTPTSAPAATLASQAIDACETSCVCGTYHGLITTLANPATGAVRFDLYDGGALVERNAPFQISTDCAQTGDVPYPAKATVPLAVGMHHVSWHGFNLAGNETAGTQVLDLNLECPAPMSPPDANMGGGDAGLTAPRADSSCSAGGSGASWGVLAFATLVLLRRKRRR